MRSTILISAILLSVVGLAYIARATPVPIQIGASLIAAQLSKDAQLTRTPPSNPSTKSQITHVPPPIPATRPPTKKLTAEKQIAAFVEADDLCGYLRTKFRPEDRTAYMNLRSPSQELAAMTLGTAPNKKPSVESRFYLAARKVGLMSDSSKGPSPTTDDLLAGYNEFRALQILHPSNGAFALFAAKTLQKLNFPGDTQLDLTRIGIKEPWYNTFVKERLEDLHDRRFENVTAWVATTEFESTITFPLVNLKDLTDPLVREGIDDILDLYHFGIHLSHLDSQVLIERGQGDAIAKRMIPFFEGLSIEVERANPPTFYRELVHVEGEETSEWLDYDIAPPDGPCRREEFDRLFQKWSRR